MTSTEQGGSVYFIGDMCAQVTLQCTGVCNMCALNFAASSSALTQNDFDFLNDLNFSLIVLK